MFESVLSKFRKSSYDATVCDVRHVVSQYMEDHPYVTRRTLVNDENQIHLKPMKKYFNDVPTNQFLLSVETGIILEDSKENRDVINIINTVQKAVDQYVYDRQAFPLRENDPNFGICYMKLRPYLLEQPEIDLYISQRYYSVSIEPEVMELTSQH